MVHFDHETKQAIPIEGELREALEAHFHEEPAEA